MNYKELYLLCPSQWHYELSTLIRQVYPFAKVLEEKKEGTEGLWVSEDGRRTCRYDGTGVCVAEEEIQPPFFLFPGDGAKNYAKQLVYRVLEARLPWGILTGVRPSKVAYAYLQEGLSVEETAGVLEQQYLLWPDKAALAAQVAWREHGLLQDHKGTDVSVYVGVPFCPTRCSYCSFISNDRRAYAKWGEDYVAALCKEIRAAGDLIGGRRLQSFYMGGGTPTTLSAEQLATVLQAVDEIFGLPNFTEITVEAGRPDTITEEKLRVLKEFGVTRLSINPQTMHQETLDRIGRKHSVEQIYEAFSIARKVGFDVINMDFILGLPGETPAHVARSMEMVLELRPENLTIHTLAIKRASVLNETGEIPDLVQQATEIEEMLRITAQTAKTLGQVPYYMYRQKNMAGNFENVGYSLPGKEGRYNIEIMEERQMILALGAGGVTKVYYPEENRLERVPNVKTADEYVNRIDEMIQRKIEGGICLCNQ